MDTTFVCQLKQFAVRDDSNGLAEALHRFKVTKETAELVFDGKKWVAFIQKADVTSLINQRFDSGYTLLHYVAECGAVKCLKYLCQLGAAVDVTSDTGTTPIHLAVDSNHITCVQELIRHRADLNLSDGWLGYATLHWAVRQRNLDMVRLLVRSGAGINLQNNEGNTPAHMAAKLGDLQILELLVTRRADLNVLNDANLKPLDISIRENHTECTQILRTPLAARPKSVREEEPYPFPKNTPQSFIYGDPKPTRHNIVLHDITSEYPSGVLSPNRLSRAATHATSIPRALSPPEIARLERSNTTWSSTGSLRYNPSAFESTSSVLSFSTSSRSLLSESPSLGDDIDYKAEMAKFDAIVHNFSSKLSSWQDLVAYIMKPAERDSKILCVLEKDTSLNGIYRFYLKWEKDSRKSLLLQSFKRLSSTTPNYPIGLSKKDITDRNTSGYLGKLRGNGAKNEYIAFNAGINPDRRSSVGRFNTRSGLATVKMSDSPTKRYTITIPNPDLADSEYVRLQSSVESSIPESPDRKKDNSMVTFYCTQGQKENAKPNLTISARTALSAEILFTYPLTPFQVFSVCLAIFDSS